MWLPFVLLLLFSWIDSSSIPEEFLPIYMKGLNWDKVEEILKDDLRLPNSVLPSNYAIELEVNVRGHSGARASNFNGTVTIYLDIIKPVDKIELHSNGLTIEKISYSGVAKLDVYGLYENWDPKFNKSMDSKGPFILVTNNFPTGARFWFPCFDEPDKKATFELHINHPLGMSTYSNSDLKRKQRINEQRMLSVFEKTESMSTYQLVLSINHLSVQPMDIEGFQTVRLLSSRNSHDYYSSFYVGNPITPRATLIDIRALLKKELEQVANTSFGQRFLEKLDVIILEGTALNTVQPGLITIGRQNLWTGAWRLFPAEDLRFLTQLRLGSHVSVKTSNAMWINEMFSHLFTNETVKGPEYVIGPCPYCHILSYSELDSSLHEQPLRHDILHSTTTKQYLAAQNNKNSQKKYSTNRTEKIADIDDFVGVLTKPCKDPELLKSFLESFINQSGKPLLIVKRSNNTVTIEQTRYHSTYFDATLRDKTTRYTIPIFYSVNGTSYMQFFNEKEPLLKIIIPETASFLIDHNYQHLYFVFYTDNILPERQITNEEYKNVALGFQKSLLAAANIGFVKYSRIEELMIYYFEKQALNYDDRKALFYSIERVLRDRSNGNDKYIEETGNIYIVDSKRCDEISKDLPDFPMDWDDLFNNYTIYWENPIYHYDLQKPLNCFTEWQNSTLYMKFLEANFLGTNSIIRPSHISMLPQRVIGFHQWRELHRFFFKNAGNITNHRFNLLAHTVLSQSRMGYDLSEDYPDNNICDDFVKELRDFVIRNPRRAASMSTEIEMALEREYVRKELSKWHNFGVEVKVESERRFG